MIKCYLEAMETFFLFSSLMLLMFGGLIIDGPAYVQGVTMLYGGVLALIGVVVCQGLKKLP